MQTGVPHLSAANKTCPVRCSSRVSPFFIVALLLVALTGVVFLVGAGWALPGVLLWLCLAVVVAVSVVVGGTCHPIRGRTDVSQLWNERLPAHTEQELQRFLQTVGESLGYRAQDRSKLGPDDDLSTLHHRWHGGDGMELVELVMFVEREYSLKLPEEFLTTDRTLGELFDHVMRAASARSTPADTGPTQPSESLP
jgi:acyl carrier protein